MIKSHISFILLLFVVHSQYSHQSSTYLNTSWMSLLDNGIPIRKLSIIGSHSSMSTGIWGDAFQTQSNSLMGQMKMGMRALDIRCRHYSNRFPIHDRLVYLNTDLGAVLATVSSFLQTYPMETILMHIVEEYNPSGNSESFQQTFITYKNQYSSYIWNPTSQNPVLGEVRGKIVIIQDFSGLAIHGLMYSTFTVLPHKWFNTNWDQYDKWTAVKNFISSSNTAGESMLSFWTGHGGSFPYFVASGKSSPGNSDPRLATGLTTPGFKNSYPDFPRVACFIGICTIAFEGINILGYNYIVNNNIKYLGIVFTDFLGDPLLQKAIGTNVGQFTPCPSTLLTQGCTFCSSTGTCLGCNSTLHYLYDSVAASCLADKGYYLAWSSPTVNLPTSCGIPMIGCLECSSDTVCTLCDSIANYQLSNGTCIAAPGYYLDASSIPVICNLVGCYTCASASVCTTCSSSKNFIMDSGTSTCKCDSSANFVLLASAGTCVCNSGYYLDSNGTCSTIPLCPASNSGCSSCSLQPTISCQMCDAVNNFQTAAFDSAYCTCMSGFYFTGLTCDSCSTTLTNACLSCISASLCLTCKYNFTLFEGKCSCLPQYYLNTSDTCYLCETGCLRCNSASSCFTCDVGNNFTLVSLVCQCNTGMYLNGLNCTPCGAMPGCLACNNAGCTSCNPTFGFTLNATTNLCQCNFGFFINSMSICEPCTQLGCLNCLSLTQCILCNTNYFYLSSGVCQDICGDGKLYTLPCDDGNIINGDGCSSTCSVQTDYTCVGGTTTTPSLCSFSGSVLIKITSFLKDPSKNKVYLTSSISPSLNEFAALDFNTVVIPDFVVQSTNTVYNTSSGVISMTFTYNQSLNSQDLSISFVPPAIPAYFYMPKVKTTLPYTTDNNLALKIYTQEEYSLASTIEMLSLGLALLAVGTFVICFFLVSKLMAIEMIFIFQVSYTSLLFLEKLELYMSKLRNLWIVNGYNQLFEDQATSLPGRVSVIYYKCSFLANFSIDIVIVLIPILLGLICLLIAKVRNNKQYRITAYRFLKEWLLSALLFVQLHLNISIALGVNYSSSLASVAFGGIIDILLIAQLVLYVRKNKNFGEYTEFFEANPTAQRWYLLVFLYRTIFSFVVGFLGGGTFGIFISLGLAVIFLIVQLIKKPYLSNIRPLVNCIFAVAILTIYTVSKIFQDSSSIYIYTSYTPFFLLGLLFFALIFNVVCMIIHLVSICRKEKERMMAKEILNENDAESKDIDKMYINTIKKNLKDSLMQNKGIEMKNFDIETEQLHKNSRLKIRNQFKMPHEDDEGDAIQKLCSAKRFVINQQNEDNLEEQQAI